MIHYLFIFLNNVPNFNSISLIIFTHEEYRVWKFTHVAVSRWKTVTCYINHQPLFDSFTNSKLEWYLYIVAIWSHFNNIKRDAIFCSTLTLSPTTHEIIGSTPTVANSISKLVTRTNATLNNNSHLLQCCSLKKTRRYTL